MVHQHFQLIPVFTVAENIMLGNELRKGPVLDLDGARARIRELGAPVRAARSTPTRWSATCRSASSSASS